MLERGNDDGHREAPPGKVIGCGKLSRRSVTRAHLADILAVTPAWCGTSRGDVGHGPEWTFDRCTQIDPGRLQRPRSRWGHAVFSEDCVLEMPRGPDPWGSRYVG